MPLGNNVTITLGKTIVIVVGTYKVQRIFRCGTEFNLIGFSFFKEWYLQIELTAKFWGGDRLDMCIIVKNKLKNKVHVRVSKGPVWYLLRSLYTSDVKCIRSELFQVKE